MPEEEEELIDPRVRLMYLANEGDVEGIKELLDSGTNVNFSDIDGRTALHVATCQGFTDVVQLLLDRGAEVDTEDRWGSTVIFSDIIWKCCVFFFSVNLCVHHFVCLQIVRNGFLLFGL